MKGEEEIASLVRDTLAEDEMVNVKFETLKA